MLIGLQTTRYCKTNVRPLSEQRYAENTFISMYNKSMKVDLENKEMGQFLERLVSPMWSFLVLFFSG